MRSSRTSNQRKRERVKRKRVGREARVHVLLVGDSKFRQFRVGPHLGILNQRLRRAALKSEYVMFEHTYPILAYPGKSCKNSDVSADIIRRVGDVCREKKDELVLALFCMGGNGVFNRTGLQSDKDTDAELDAHQQLLSELLAQNANLCVLAFGIIPRPAIPQHEKFLRMVNYRMRQNVMAVARMTGGRVNFEEVGVMLRARPHLFARDGVHLTWPGTRALLTNMVEYFRSTAPLNFAPA